MADIQRPERLSIDAFLAREDAPEVAELIGKFNGGSFMNCHCMIFAETGVWIDELVPVFQKLDAQLSVTNDRKVAVLSQATKRS